MSWVYPQTSLPVLNPYFILVVVVCWGDFRLVRWVFCLLSLETCLSVVGRRCCHFACALIVFCWPCGAVTLFCRCDCLFLWDFVCVLLLLDFFCRRIVLSWLSFDFDRGVLWRYHYPMFWLLLFSSTKIELLSLPWLFNSRVMLVLPRLGQPLWCLLLRLLAFCYRLLIGIIRYGKGATFRVLIFHW
jgi:hypothetical protein